MNLAGKTAAVTGGGRGLGKAIALTLARAGANVWIGNRKEEQAEQTVKEIQEMGGKAGYTVMDVANFDDVQR
ncbi:MAG: SDR family NAD(P)-dependent oxidoreductase, partial [Fibrobacter sp.]|nr:SDR family NAD(P)-dependent oxidoreductase [Fibrobacter sp.]